MKKNFVLLILPAFLLSMQLTFVSGTARAGEYGTVSIKVQAALFLKILHFHNDINKTGDVVIHVVDSPEFAARMRSAIGGTIGTSRISAVNEGMDWPEKKPSVVYVSGTDNVEKIIDYTRSRGILSITGVPGLVSRGVTLGIGAFQGKPRILLNLASSKAEGNRWNPAILKISTRVD